MKMIHLARFTLLVSSLLSAPAFAADSNPAYTPLTHGRVQEATNLLRQQLVKNSTDAHAHELLCRVAYAQELADEALSECEQAVNLAPNDSEAQMWLGRSLGLKASHTNPVTAYKLARRVRTAFERAVQLNPRNVEAASDLGEYYIYAPGFLGGDETRAQALIAQLAPLSAFRSHRLEGLLQQKKGNLAEAEAAFKAAVAAGNSPEAWTDLALFYEKQKRQDEVVGAIHQALTADRTHGAVEVDAASILTSIKREPETAEQALRNYLASSNQAESAPVFKVHLQLGKLLDHRGDKDGAKAEFAAAVALAPNYQPARKALED